MTPIVDGIETQYNRKIALKRIDANKGDGPVIMRDYRILGHPTTLIFNDDGQEVARFIGPQTTETVEETLLTILENK